MMTQRMTVGSRPKAADMAGKAMFTAPSSPTSRKAAAARTTGMAPSIRPAERLTPAHQSGRRKPMPFPAGLTAEIEQVVVPELTADALGNHGVRVFAMELTCNAAMKPHLPPGGASVGTMVEMKHLAATPLGMKVRAKATLLESDEKRCLFQVEVFDKIEKIADGRHERFVVPNLEKFLSRAMTKGRA